MSAATTGKNSKKKAAEPHTDWKGLRALTDSQIHANVLEDPGVRPTDEAFWATAKVVMPHPKRTVTMRLDADLLEWFRRNR